jgi:hypothetical protein
MGFREVENVANPATHISAMDHRLIRVALFPMGFANSTDPRALAFAGHEFGHVSKPLITIVHGIIRDLLVIALVASIVASFLLPFGVYLLIGIAIVNALWFCVKIAYERRASIDGLASLIERKFIDKDGDITSATQTLQLALQTYLPIWPQWLGELCGCIENGIPLDIGYICGNTRELPIVLKTILGVINFPLGLIALLQAGLLNLIAL